MPEICSFSLIKIICGPPWCRVRQNGDSTGDLGLSFVFFVFLLLNMFFLCCWCLSSFFVFFVLFYFLFIYFYFFVLFFFYYSLCILVYFILFYYFYYFCSFYCFSMHNYSYLSRIYVNMNIIQVRFLYIYMWYQL